MPPLLKVGPKLYESGVEILRFFYWPPYTFNTFENSLFWAEEVFKQRNNSINLQMCPAYHWRKGRAMVLIA